MIELRFHEELYDGFAIDEAVKLYEPYATFTLTREPGGFVVKIAQKAGDDDAADESLIAAELMNYALGKTIERARTAPSAQAGAPDPGGAPAQEAA